MTAKLFLPDLHAFCIRIFGVIDAQAVAKDTLQTTHDLYGQGDLGQEIKHLLFLFQCLTNQVDIDFGLSAGGNAVKERDVLLKERELNLVVGILLNRT